LRQQPPRNRGAALAATSEPDGGAVAGFGGWLAWSGGWAASTPTTKPWFSGQSGHLTVPPLPLEGNSGQVVFLFHALVTQDGGIIQPVLQFGSSAAGDAGNQWMIASWYVNQARGIVVASELVPIDVGVDFFGYMSSSNCDSTGHCDWKILSRNKSTLQESVLNVHSDEVFDGSETGVLEGLDIERCDQVPKGFVDMWDVYPFQPSTKSVFGEITSDHIEWDFRLVSADISPHCTFGVSRKSNIAVSIRLGGDGFIQTAAAAPAISWRGGAILAMGLAAIAGLAIRRSAALVLVLSLGWLPGCETPPSLTEIPGSGSNPASVSAADAATDGAAAPADDAQPTPDGTVVTVPDSMMIDPLCIHPADLGDRCALVPTGYACVVPSGSTVVGREIIVPPGTAVSCKPECEKDQYEVVCTADDVVLKPAPTPPLPGCRPIKAPRPAGSVALCCPCD
jgi:hypothetical protein